MKVTATKTAAEMAILQAQRRQALVDEVLPALFAKIEYSSYGYHEAKMGDVVLEFFNACAASKDMAQYLTHALASQGFTVDRLEWEWLRNSSRFIIRYNILCGPPEYKEK